MTTTIIPPITLPLGTSTVGPATVQPGLTEAKLRASRDLPAGVSIHWSFKINGREALSTTIVGPQAANVPLFGGFSLTWTVQAAAGDSVQLDVTLAGGPWLTGWIITT